MRVVQRYLLLPVFLLVGCHTTTTVDTASNCFELCLDAKAEVDLSAELEATVYVTDTLESVRTTFSTYLDGMASFRSLVSALTDGDLKAPKGFRYRGNGTYEVSGTNGATANVTFYLPFDTSYGKRGSAIDFDVFDPDNYLSGISAKTSVTVDLSGINTKVEYGFTDSGPGVELLGLEASPQSPIELDETAATQSLLQVQGSAAIDDTTDANGAFTQVVVDSPRVAANALMEAISLEVRSFAVERNDLAQSLSMTDEDLSLVDGGRVYDGTFDFSASSPRLNFDGRLRFRGGANADIALGCPNAELTFEPPSDANGI